MGIHAMNDQAGYFVEKVPSEEDDSPRRYQVWQAAVEAMFTDEQWGAMKAVHRRLTSFNGMRLAYHWLGLSDESVLEETSKLRAARFLEMMLNANFHPFADVTIGERIIREAYEDKENSRVIWVFRLSTTIPGAITITRPTSLKPLAYAHCRFKPNDEGKFTIGKVVYDKLEEFLTQITLWVQKNLPGVEVDMASYTF